MAPAEFIESLLVRGFVVARRTTGGAVWLRRGVQELMIDTTQNVPDDLASRLLREADDTAD